MTEYETEEEAFKDKVVRSVKTYKDDDGIDVRITIDFTDGTTINVTGYDTARCDRMPIDIDVEVSDW